MEPLGLNIWILAGIAGIVLMFFFAGHICPGARVRRRRRRNYTPVISTVRRPIVKFSVRTRRV